MCAGAGLCADASFCRQRLGSAQTAACFSIHDSWCRLCVSPSLSFHGGGGLFAERAASASAAAGAADADVDADASDVSQGRTRPRARRGRKQRLTAGPANKTAAKQLVLHDSALCPAGAAAAAANKLRPSVWLPVLSRATESSRGGLRCSSPIRPDIRALAS